MSYATLLSLCRRLSASAPAPPNRPPEEPEPEDSAERMEAPDALTAPKPRATADIFWGSCPSASDSWRHFSANDDMSIESSAATASGSFLSCEIVVARFDFGSVESDATACWSCESFAMSTSMALMAERACGRRSSWLAMEADTFTPSRRARLPASCESPDTSPIWPAAAAAADRFLPIVEDSLTPFRRARPSANWMTCAPSRDLAARPAADRPLAAD